MHCLGSRSYTRLADSSAAHQREHGGAVLGRRDCGSTARPRADTMRVNTSVPQRRACRPLRFECVRALAAALVLIT